jgi:Domain of unknown function (DUF1854)
MMTEIFDITEDTAGGLTLHRSGEEDVKNVRIRRAFPWSAPQAFVSIRTAEGKELVLIEDLNQLPPDLRKRIEAWLSQHSFIPHIMKIDQVDVRFGYQIWKVQTDRGPAEFRVQEREDIRFLHDGRFSIKDADGNVYELKPLEQLDPASRRAIEPLL